MKTIQRSLFISFLLSPTIPVLTQTVGTGAKAADVATKFYSTYNIDELQYNRVAFEKRRNGWYVITQSVHDNKLQPVDKFLFFDNSSNDYRPLPIPKNFPAKEVNALDYMDEPELANYDVQAYYGYRGWFKDVIAEFAKRQNLSDNELNGLGRAYSNYATSLLSDQLGDALPAEQWKLPLSINCLSIPQIERFNSLEKNALDCFRKLADRNPDFETRVGKINVKYANEIMVQFTTLLAYAHDYTLKMKLPENLYTAEQLVAARDILDNCPVNAIFISFGDNDYYPLHYLQYNRGLRKDVYVVNYSLIGIDRYIKLAGYPQYDADAITLLLDDSMYAGSKNDVIYIQDSSRSVDFMEIIDSIKTAHRRFYGSIAVKADAVLLPVGKEEKNEAGASIGMRRMISLKGHQYLLKNDWILLDILYNLNGRKICFAYNFDGTALNDLKNHITSNHGLYFYND